VRFQANLNQFVSGEVVGLMQSVGQGGTRIEADVSLEAERDGGRRPLVVEREHGLPARVLGPADGVTDDGEDGRLAVRRAGEGEGRDRERGEERDGSRGDG